MQSLYLTDKTTNSISCAMYKVDPQFSAITVQWVDFNIDDNLIICSSLLFAQFFYHGQQPLVAQGLLIIEDSWSHSVIRTTIGRTPLDEWSAWWRVLYLTPHCSHNRQTSMPAARYEPTIPASERPQTHSLDRAANGISLHEIITGKLYQ